MRTKLIILGIFTLIFAGVSAQTNNTATIDATSTNANKINRFIYSQFSEHLGNCIYDGIWVGENSKIPNKDGIRTDVVNALKEIQIPALRWPGGCFADEYHWKDGIGTKSDRPKMINTNWGGVTEDNSFGTHEFMDLCNQLNCEAYISGNMGSGTVQEMSQWVEYITSGNESPMTDLRKSNGQEDPWKVSFWGVGNESWGCGGRMKAQYYANEALKFSAFLKNYSGNNLKQIMVGPNAEDYNWTDIVMRETGKTFWGMSLHYYTWLNASATDFKEDEWFNVMKSTLKMKEIIEKHAAIMDQYDPDKNVALVVDEWGTWYNVEPGTNPGFLFQQNSLRDALVAGVNLNIFNNHCDRVKMTCIAQVVNVLQSMILTKGEKMLLTPTYHVFDMYKVHQDAYLVPSQLNCENYEFNGESVPALNMSSSIDNNGIMHISICNLQATKAEELACNLKGYLPESVTGKIITAEKLNTYNSFDKPDQISIQNFSAFKLDKQSLNVTIPPHSVITLEVKGQLNLGDQSVKPKNPVKGLSYKIYSGNWYNIPDYRSMKPIQEGVVSNLVFPEKNPGSNFAIVYEGYIKADQPGIYNFAITSDDGAKMYINDHLVVNNDGRHGNIEREGITYMSKGYHPFRLEYFQAGGGMTLDLKMMVKIEGNFKKTEIPDEVFWHEK
ncbi:MAG TPA: alpha-L-arabinofuranosidase C-terminal domain-containing protein [Prolixibacteraceae bacterium]|nr:alpha-L-arabinofuranosidase C-terminal domain-containing protein [Prolixibacteraceae bacterium]HPS12117.1 alpha-L-arabinofuranosidase C-terminal domain-containing protein [Prolixibacteraceae bacterium]